MISHTHHTAPTRFVEAYGIRYAYRRFGKQGGTPLLFCMHFAGTMDYWDPEVTDGFAKNHDVILFNNAGVSSSSGTVPTSIEEMAQHAANFVRALHLEEVDVLGLSIGGFIAHEFAFAEPDLCRRLILVGTGPKGGEGMDALSQEAQEIFAETYANPEHVWLKIMFPPVLQVRKQVCDSSIATICEPKHVTPRRARVPKLHNARQETKGSGSGASLRLPGRDPTTDSRGQRIGRYCGVFDKFFYPPAQYSERAIDYLPRFEPRIPLSVP